MVSVRSETMMIASVSISGLILGQEWRNGEIGEG